MLAYIIRRLLAMVLTLFGITLITFFIIQMAPGDPIELTAPGGMMDAEAQQTSLDKMRAAYGLDKPWYQQYFIWATKLLVLDFGVSFKDNQPVLERIWERVPRTVSLNLVVLIVVYSISIPAGILSAVFYRSLFDKVSGLTFYAMYSVPNFWLALLMQYYFGVVLGIFPLIGLQSTDAENLSFFGRLLDYAHHSFMIVVCLSINSFAFFSRFIRANMLETVNQDYIRTARAKGLDGTVVYMRHALRNTLIPVITMLATILPALISGSVILESIFNWPGLGLLFFDAILTRDYPTIMANSFISASLVLISLLLADLLYAVVDPRVSLS